MGTNMRCLILGLAALALVGAEAQAAQYARPAGTLSNSNWSPSTLSLHEDTDEVTADDGDYFNTTSASAQSPATAELSLSAVTDPVSSVGHIMRCRFITFGSKSGEKLTFRLMQGTTEIAAVTNQTSRGSYTTLAYTLSGAQADAITDGYADLRFIVETTSVVSADGDEIQVSWLELEVPTAAGAVAPTVITPDIQNVTDTGADLGGDISDTGGENPNERGVYWSLSTGFNPPGEGAKIPETGDFGTGIFWVPATLPQSELIYFQAFATNSGGTGFTTEGALQTEPTTQASGISFSAVGTDTITVDWSTSADANVDGSLVVMREGSQVPAGSLPVDGTLHPDGSGVFEAGADLGSLSYVVFRGTGNSAVVTGLTASTTYWVKVFTYAGSGTGQAGINYQQDGPQEASQDTSGAGPQPPTLINPSIAAVDDLTATLGGRISVSESPPVTERGIYWSTTPGFTPPGQGAKVSTTGSWSSFPLDFTETNVSGWAEGSLVYFRAFAVDGAGEGYAAQASFQAEPTTQATTIVFSSVLANSMTISWTAGSGDGALVVIKQGTGFTQLPTDGTEHSFSSTFGSGDDLGGASEFVVYRGPANSAPVAGLTAETEYSVRVFEYAGSGSGVAGINYQQVNPPLNSTTTPVATSTPSHNALRNIQCDQCHSMHGTALVPREAAQETVCKACHNETQMGAENTHLWDITLHTVNDGSTIIDCGSCHDLHNYNFETNNTSHGGTTADNIARIRWDTSKYVAGALEPAIFQQRPGHFAFFRGDFSSGPFNGICQTCHQNTSNHTNNGWDNDSDPLVQADNDHQYQGVCTTCHGHNDGFLPSGCTDCHNTAQDKGDGAPSRRAVVSEFSMTAHHVGGGGAVTNNDCKVCHYEAVDGSTHQNNVVDLRDPDNGNRITIGTTNEGFTKFTRDRSSDSLEEWITTIQTEFCLRCHDSDGALASYNVEDGGTAIRPFSSTSRDVPMVYESFDPANSFHHAVRDAAANAYCIPRASSTPAFNPTMESPWNQDTTGGLYSDGHDMITCFDCHGTIVTDPDGTSNLVSAHGGSNQRMLRVPVDFDGIEAAQTAGNSALIPANAGGQTETFCTLCHKAEVYLNSSTPEELGSVYPHHPGSQGQHGWAGSNPLGCMGCHAGIVDFSNLSGNGALRGNLHGDNFTWPGDSFASGFSSESFMLGGWISGWEVVSGTGYCRGGQCNHANSSKNYPRP